MNALFEQIRSTVDRLSGLAQALGDTPVPAGDDRTVLVPAERIEETFSSVARAARLELLEVRPDAPGRGGEEAGSPGVPRPGVRHRLIAGPRTAGALSSAAGRGTEVRTTGLLTLRAVIADREALALAVAVTDDRGCLLSVRHPDAAARFAARFLEDWWPRACPCVPVTTVAESATEAAVIAALAQGLTDECVARRVGVTPRTVRRHVAAVSARFGATSRLQLGVMIGRSTRDTAVTGPATAPETPPGAPGRSGPPGSPDPLGPPAPPGPLGLPNPTGPHAPLGPPTSLASSTSPAPSASPAPTGPLGPSASAAPPGRHTPLASSTSPAPPPQAPPAPTGAHTPVGPPASPAPPGPPHTPLSPPTSPASTGPHTPLSPPTSPAPPGQHAPLGQSASPGHG